MPALVLSPRVLARLGTLVLCALPFTAAGLPPAHATDTTVHLTLAQGESESIGQLVSNTDVTPVPTCDPQLSVSFDATMAGTVTVAADATQGTHTCSVDYQVSGQSTGLVEDVVVDVIAPCADSVCVFNGSDFSGTAFNAGFPSMSCTAAPIPIQSVANDIIFHVEFYQDSSCQVFDVEVQSGTNNPNLPAPALSYETFICGQEC